MAKMWTYFFVMLWLLFMISAGIHVFSKGFLLSRITTTTFSKCIKLETCSDKNNDTCLHEGKVNYLLNNVNDSVRYCLPKKSKVILLVIDALRYDFGVYNPNLSNPMPHQNRLPIIHQLLTEHPHNSRIAKFIADPPTTTLQRLKGLTTGSLPTFIDIGSNFATPEINEDNVIDQIIRNNLSAVFMGDSTWIDLFPNRFKREYSFPSFNIYDLDTVDTEIKKVLPRELKSNDWDMLIAHFLGVDHCGHKFGPLHQEMSRKLLEMNEVIKNVVNDMDEDTTLFVVGDHGMTGTGDHGGESTDETNALLFSYSKKYNFVLDEDAPLIEMRQIDLVPTLSIILGIPIPFSNLGAINFNLLPDIPVEHLNSHQLFLLHSWQNAVQIRSYFTNYTAMSRGLFEDELLDDQYMKFMIFSFRATSLYTDDALENFHKDLKQYLDDVLKIFSDVWINFDPSQMSQGLIFVSVTTILIYLLIGCMRVVYFNIIFTRNKVLFIYFGNIFMGTIAYYYHYDLTFGSKEQGIIVLTSIFNIMFLSFLVLEHWYAVSDSLEKQRGSSNIISRFIFVFSISVFYSNSFIVQEQKILCYILMGLICILFFNIKKTSIRFDLKNKSKLSSIISSNWGKLAMLTMFAVLLLRSSYSFFRCREEQGNCTDFHTLNKHLQTDKKTSNSTLENQKSDLIPVVVLAFFVTITRMYLRFAASLNGFSFGVTIAKFGPIICAICIGGHFVLSQTLLHGVKQINIDALAWIIYAIFTMHLLIVITKPLMVYVKPKTKPFEIEYPCNVIPTMFKKLKQDYSEKDTYKDERPYVMGISTVYSSVLISFGVTAAMLIAILLGPSAANGLFISLLVGVVILGLSAVLRFQTARTLDLCLQPQFLTLIAWTLLAHFSFYATSHQPTLSQIDWHAAFVGRSAKFDHSNVISAVLVLLNTFGGSIIIFLLYPLLTLAGPCLHAKIPSLIPKPIKHEDNSKVYKNGNGVVNEHEFNFKLGRGELALYENENLFIGTVFKVGCQLFVMQGLRIFCSMLACTILCRHLMVWKIFAPKFIYEGISTYLSLIAILIGFAITVRVHGAFMVLVQKITKTKNE